MTGLPQIDRRTTIKWMLATLGGTGLATGCGRTDVAPADAFTLGEPMPIGGRPYGPDPDMNEGAVTWPHTMTDLQRRLVSALSDTVLPANDQLPSGSAVGVPDFIDEWVSSPYSRTRSDRDTLFSLFEWLEMEAQRLGGSFVDSSEKQRREIIDRIAWRDRIETGLDEQAKAFDSFRYLATSAYFASEEGSEWIGYQGNTPLTGDYPGPTAEALDHLSGVLASLNLEMPEGL